MVTEKTLLLVALSLPVAAGGGFDSKSKAALTSVYDDLSGFGTGQSEANVKAIKQAGDNYISTYGETKTDSILQILDDLGMKPGSVFYDLGSGIGKNIVAGALSFNLGKAVGIELDEMRFEQACVAISRLKGNGTKENPGHWPSGAHTHIEFRKKDFFSVDLREADAVLTIIYRVPKIENLLKSMKTGAVFISLSQLSPKQQVAASLSNYKSAKITNDGVKNYAFGWSSNVPVYFYQKERTGSVNCTDIGAVESCESDDTIEFNLLGKIDSELTKKPLLTVSPDIKLSKEGEDFQTKLKEILNKPVGISSSSNTQEEAKKKQEAKDEKATDKKAVEIGNLQLSASDTSTVKEEKKEEKLAETAATSETNKLFDSILKDLTSKKEDTANSEKSKPKLNLDLQKGILPAATHAELAWNKHDALRKLKESTGGLQALVFKEKNSSSPATASSNTPSIASAPTDAGLQDAVNAAMAKLKLDTSSANSLSSAISLPSTPISSAPPAVVNIGSTASGLADLVKNLGVKPSISSSFPSISTPTLASIGSTEPNHYNKASNANIRKFGDNPNLPMSAEMVAELMAASFLSTEGGIGKMEGNREFCEVFQ